MYIARVQFQDFNSLVLENSGRQHSEVAPQTLGQSIKHTMSIFKEGTQNITNTQSRSIQQQRGKLELDSGLIQSIFTVAANNKL